MSTERTAAAILSALDTITAETIHARDYAASGPNHTHRPGQTAEQAAWQDVDEARTIVGRIADTAARVAGGEYRPEYNGHPNRETWNASLWIDNEPGTYNGARDIVRDAFASYAEPAMLATIRGDRSADELARDRHNGAIADAADMLRDWYDELNAPEDSASPLADAWTYALACVDWRAVAEGIADGLDPAALAPEPDDDETDDA